MALILVVDDKASMRKMLASALKEEGHQVRAAASGEEALRELQKGPFELVLTDVRMPGLSGMELLRQVRSRQRPLSVIVMTAFGAVEDAVEAMKMGAADYLSKPFSLDHLKLAVDKALAMAALAAENRGLREQIREAYDFSGVPGESAAMRKVHALIRRVAPLESAVLIQGESGTGKELVARAIHANSRRRDKPFLKVNCAALPEGLLESELFGHEKGAFTGAHQRSLGRFELARGGTLFLDEVGEIPLPAQVKLLRVLQEKEFERLGGAGMPLSADVRVLAASNRDLRQATAQGQFRQDLFFRLNVVPVQLPPLRDRAEDIAPLARHFLKKYQDEVRPGCPFRLSPEALRQLSAYAFPGNVRELENLIQRAMVLVDKDGLILPEHLPAEISEGGGAAAPRGEAASFSARVDGFERDMILEALRRSRGSQAQAARQMGIQRTLLIYKMKKYGISSGDFKEARPPRPGRAGGRRAGP